MEGKKMPFSSWIFSALKSLFPQCLNPAWYTLKGNVYQKDNVLILKQNLLVSTAGNVLQMV